MRGGYLYPIPPKKNLQGMKN